MEFFAGMRSTEHGPFAYNCFCNGYNPTYPPLCVMHLFQVDSLRRDGVPDDGRGFPATTLQQANGTGRSFASAFEVSVSKNLTPERAKAFY
eukprot:615072-Pelagomonas_calceolata.AAC.7